jgi:serine protease
MRKLKSTLVLAATLAALLAAPSGAPASERSQHVYAPGELLVRFDGSAERVLELPADVGVAEAAKALRSNPGVDYATPNYLARAAAVPNDPGKRGQPGDWRYMQWNFLPCGSTCGQSDTPLAFQAGGGINAIQAWKTLHSRGLSSGHGVRVAVLDTGIAYRTLKPTFKKSPDFSRKQFLRGHDYVKGGKLALDRDGHGTHVAGTIAERTDNGVALTGLAPAAKIIPVRVLGADGFGTARQITRGIRFAVRNGADVINMSFEFSSSVNSCKKIPSVCKALRFATKRHGVLVVAAAGNFGARQASFPGRAPRVIAVGGTTRDGCVADYSSFGTGLDLVAPGGGSPRVIECGDSQQDQVDPIFQLTFSGLTFTEFGYPGFYEGTSMSSAHVSGLAAMVISSGVLGRHPARATLECQLKQTARDSDEELGQPYDPILFGAGLVDAAAAVNSRAPGC